MHGRSTDFVARVRALAREAIRDDGRLNLAGRQRQPPRRAERELEQPRIYAAPTRRGR